MPNLCACCKAPELPEQNTKKKSGSDVGDSWTGNLPWNEKLIPYLAPEVEEELRKTAKALLDKDGGILVADESSSAMEEHFQLYNVMVTEENKRKYREMLVSDNTDILNSVGGFLMSDEMFKHKTKSGVPFFQVLEDKGVMVGIRADRKLAALAGSPGEVATEGLDDLSKRCGKYKGGGCQFSMWRCVYNVTEYAPTRHAMINNAAVLARYAVVSQHHDMVPIIDVDVLADGDNDWEEIGTITEEVLTYVIKALLDHHVYLEGLIVKLNMVVAGKDSTPEEIANRTIEVLARTVPPAVAGIAFSVGVQSEDDAKLNLTAIKEFKGRKPWPVTFCPGKALQESILAAFTN